MLRKVQVRTTEKGKNRLIVEVILDIYPYQRVMQKNYNDDEVRYTFLIDRDDLDLLRHDLNNLRLCGFNAEEVKAQ